MRDLTEAREYRYPDREENTHMIEAIHEIIELGVFGNHRILRPSQFTEMI